MYKLKTFLLKKKQKAFVFGKVYNLDQMNVSDLETFKDKIKDDISERTLELIKVKVKIQNKKNLEIQLGVKKNTEGLERIKGLIEKEIVSLKIILEYTFKLISLIKTPVTMVNKTTYETMTLENLKDSRVNELYPTWDFVDNKQKRSFLNYALKN